MFGIHNAITRFAIQIISAESLIYARQGEKLFYSDKEDIMAYQKRQLRNIYLYAYKHTRYYREVFDRIGLIENGEVQWSKEKDIPILTKDLIRDNYEGLISDECLKRKAYSNTSGGSTGVPVSFLQDKSYFNRNFGNLILMGRLNQKYEGDREIKLWGSERDILKGSISLKDKAVNLVFNRVLLNSFLLTDELMRQYCEIINNYKPKQIWAYVDSIFFLSNFISNNNIKMFSPLNIITTAGCLYDDIRISIKKAFPGSRVLNQYGSREVGLIGCDVGNENDMIVFEHAQRVEVMNPVNNAISDYGEGCFIITNLNNYSMPIIRYEIGDEGVLGEGNGTSKYKRIIKMNGRQNAHIVKKGGGKIHGEYFTHLFYNKKWVNSFKVIQHTIDNVEFVIVLNDCYSESDKEVVEDLNNMISDSKAITGEITITVRFTDHIEKLSSGKYQFVITEVNDINE